MAGLVVAALALAACAARTTPGARPATTHVFESSAPPAVRPGAPPVTPFVTPGGGLRPEPLPGEPGGAPTTPMPTPHPGNPPAPPGPIPPDVPDLPPSDATPPPGPPR